MSAQQAPGAAHVFRVGKSVAGRVLDELTHNNFLEVQRG